MLAEFQPAALFETGHLQVMADFLRGFLPPSTAPDFLALLAKATLETLAIATAGIALAFLIAAPLAVLASRAAGGLAHRPGSGPAPQRRLCAPARAQC